jgi:NAD(P)-dependent dehydrogenase (short-subunit alcohol dehydrogenase family)
VPQVAIITGGGYGIGRASCALLAAEGWRIVTVDRDTAHNAETVRAVAAHGGEAVAVDGDVADGATAAAACRAAERLGPLRALVNAAAMRHAGTIEAITEAQWDETLAACLRGTFVFSKAAVPALAAAGGGAIVNFSSTSAYVHAGMIAYASAKAAIETFTRCLAVDHQHQRIRANAIVPPFTVTGMTEHYPAAALAERDARSPSGRAARPDDVARLVRYLVSDDSATFTGGVFGTTLPMATR